MDNKNFDYHFNKVKGVIYNYHKAGKDIFSANALDKEDLEQEARLVIWKILEAKTNKMPAKELEKYIFTAVIRKLHKLKRASNRYSERIETTDLETSLADRIIEERPNEQEFAMLKDYIKEHCSELEFQIINKRFFDKKSYEDIAKELNFSRSYILKVYLGLRKKLYKKLKKQQK